MSTECIEQRRTLRCQVAASIAFLTLVSAVGACTDPVLGGRYYSCTTDADCLGGYACSLGVCLSESQIGDIDADSRTDGHDARDGAVSPDTTIEDVGDSADGCVSGCEGLEAPQCWEWVLTGLCDCELIKSSDATPCTDGNLCTAEDRCEDGFCRGSLVDAANFCDDCNPCTVDGCDAATGCVYAPADGGCSDGNPCTAGEVCLDGGCQASTQYVCEVCEEGAADDCEDLHGDGNPCNGVLACSGGFCVLGSTSISACEVTLGNPCREAVCNEETGEYITQPGADGRACVDRSPCTSGDVCKGGVCAGEPIAAAICQCLGDADCLKLDDGDRCNGVPRCLEGTCIYDPESVVVCDSSGDSDCLRNGCDPADGVCKVVYAEQGTGCDDGNGCTLGESCAFGNCDGGAAVDCTYLDGQCRKGTCDPDQGCRVEPTRDDESCIPTSHCVEAASCKQGACVAATTVACDDQDPCTIDSCNPASGCVHTGPEKPVCSSDGVCNAGVDHECRSDAYSCAYDLVADYSLIEFCDAKDNDCDGETDEACVETQGCALGAAVSATSDLQGCSVPVGLSAAESATTACASGWAMCTHSQLVERAQGAPLPSGFLIAAGVTYDAAAERWSVADSADLVCAPMEGSCGGDHTIQALTIDGVFAGSVPYATPAWGCTGGTPDEDCASLRPAGVMCCKTECDAHAQCDDGVACTADSCDPETGRCVHDPGDLPECPQQGVCAGADLLACDGGAWRCTVETVDGYEIAEVSCDGLDNDCDGLTDADDEDFQAAPMPICPEQEGVCAGARHAPADCVGGAWQPCPTARYAEASPHYESGGEATCDGLDNDCSGEADESFLFQGMPVGSDCDGRGACGLGTVECLPEGSGATCSTDPGGTADDSADEVCDGLDNDCNGLVDDEVAPAVSPCSKLGVCGDGGSFETCDGEAGWQCVYFGVSDWEADEVSCDGLDNDCDGSTDEGFTYLDGPAPGFVRAKGDPCEGTGLPCGAAVVVCRPDGTGLTCSNELGGIEVCDDEDNDCDGSTDEGLVYDDPALGERTGGQLCFGFGVCGAGTVVCSASGGITCSSNPGGPDSQATGEVCDGADNDCDGRTDEVFTLEGVQVGWSCDGEGLCGLGTIECGPEGEAVCSTDPEGSISQATPEVCDGFDNDCDGYADEGLTTADSSCLMSGVCTPNNVVATCNGLFGWTCDYGAVADYNEGDEQGLCDGRDNDCDGETDEDSPGLGDPCDGEDDDLCASGVWACGIAEDLVCAGDVSIAEACGGDDEDCDGEIDEAGAEGCVEMWRDGDGDGWGAGEPECVCEPDPASGLTATVDGDCADDAPAVHPDAGERCDGVDNDCDGKIDAQDTIDLLLTDLQPCEQAEGVCGRVTKSVNMCVGGAWSPCTDETYQLSLGSLYRPEGETLCDGVDNDCDGSTDADDPDLEGNTPFCETQVGVCVGATKPVGLCAGGAWAPCNDAAYAAHASSYEVGEELTCDGADNDCDGEPDDPFAYEDSVLGESCDGVGSCGLGTVECSVDMDKATCSTNPDGSERADVPETCNEKDDDCDGATDDGLEIEDSTCARWGICEGLVVASCTSGQWICDYGLVPQYKPDGERECDRRDEDCDGQTDEDFAVPDPGGGPPRMPGDPCLPEDSPCPGSIYVCKGNEDEMACSGATGGIPEDGETCDGLDNDCDGDVDEEDALGCVPHYSDEDFDGWGTASSKCYCGPVGEYAALVPGDCEIKVPSIHPEAPDLCDGLENDCDSGAADGSGHPGIGEPCDGGDEGYCEEGTLRCTGDGLVCDDATGDDYEGPPGDATCTDGDDNDCDGLVDDDAPNCSWPCEYVAWASGVGDREEWESWVFAVDPPPRGETWAKGQWKSNLLDEIDALGLPVNARTESIIGVEMLLAFFLDEPLVDDRIEVTVTAGGTNLEKAYYVAAALNGRVGSSAAGISTIDLTVLHDWQWSDLDPTTRFRIRLLPTGEPEGTAIFVDGIGMRVTYACESP